MAYGSWPIKNNGPHPYNKVTSGKPRQRRVWPAVVLLAFVLYGAFVYTRDSAGHAAIDARGQRQSLNLQPKAGGMWQPTPGSIDGVVVLGMHRSGTSMVTGLLQEMGFHLGEPDDILGAREGENDKGFFERLQVVVQNDKLMKEQDVNWSLNIFNFNHLLALEHALTSKVDFGLGRAALTFFNNPVHHPWAVKDPRLCFTLKFWLPFWRTPPAVLFVYRHPMEVAKSLIHRGNEFGLPRALYLWIAYNRLAIQNSQGLCRVVISNAALIQDGAGVLGMVYEQLRGCGVDVPRKITMKDINSFIDHSLHHQTQNHAKECQPTIRKSWKSEAAGDHEKARQNDAYAHALRVYCAMENGSAFSPSFEWEDLGDTAPS